MSALRLLFSSDVFLPRGYALGWEPVLLVADVASELLLAAGAAALLIRATRHRANTELAHRRANTELAQQRANTVATAALVSEADAAAPAEAASGSLGLVLFSALLGLSALVEVVAIWRFWPGISALLRGAAGCAALFACRARRASSSAGR